MIWTMIMAIEDDNDRSFVDHIYHKYRKNMLAVCYSILHNEENAQDALADAFERVIKHAKQLQSVPPSKLPALLYTYAENTAKTLYHKIQRESGCIASAAFHTVDEEDTIQMDLPDQAFDIEQIVLDNELIVEVSNIIEGFPDDLRSVAMLKWFSGYRNHEIMEMLDISRTAVDVRIHRARQRLQKQLAKRFTQA